MLTINNSVLTETIGNYTIQVEYDNNPGMFNPICEGYFFGQFTCFHNRYNLSSPGLDLNQDELNIHIKRSDVISLPIYIYDHSGITINTTGFSCSWDSGQIGYIHITKAEIYERFKVKRISKNTLKRVNNALVETVQYIDDYLTGNVFCYDIYDSEDNEVGGCSGFIGEPEYCLEYAREEVKAFIKKDELTN